MQRRHLLKGAVAAGTVGALAGCAASTAQAPMTSSRAAPVQVPRSVSEILREAPPMHLERAYALMEAEDLQGLVVTDPVNVYHLTGYWPVGARMGPASFRVTALLSRDPAHPIAVVSPEFTFYYLMADNDFRYPHAVYLFTGPADAAEAAAARADGFSREPAAGPSRMFVDRGLEPVESRELARQAAVQSALSLQPASADREFALLRALRDAGMDRGRIAVDSQAIEAVVSAAGLPVTPVPAASLLSRLRLVKSPREVELMRIAAAANADAVMAAATAIREGATLREFRMLFFAEAASRGNRGVFMVVDGVGAEGADATLRDGQALMFDAVSEGAGYHGDFARTIYVGEPAATMKQVTAAIELGWSAVREALRPGLRYSEITAIGRQAVRRAGYDFLIAFQPHSCGLYHSDATGLGDVVLEPGMVLSVDCPIMETGVGGTAHLEDLTLITGDGSEPIHDVTPATLTI